MMTDTTNTTHIYPCEREEAPPIEPFTRLLGPVPAGTDIEPEPDDHMFAHPGGPRPAWGGYAPIVLDEAAEAHLRETRPDVVRLLAGDFERAYMAHTTGTILLRRGSGWYVACPDRPCRRAVVIACDALREQRGGALDALIGLRPDEREAAEAIFARRGQAWSSPLPWEPQAEPVKWHDGGEVEIIRRLDGDEE